MADLVWSKLSGVFSKEVLHAQHLSTFCKILQAKSTKGKRQLDCAGVVTTVLAVLQQLALLGGHDDLRSCCLQVSAILTLALQSCLPALGTGSWWSACNG